MGQHPFPMSNSLSRYQPLGFGSRERNNEGDDRMGRCRCPIAGILITLLLALEVETRAQRMPPVAHLTIEASLEAVEGKLVLAVSASPQIPEALGEPIHLQVEISLEKGASGLSSIGIGTLAILPGASLRLPIVLEESGERIQVGMDPETSALLTIHWGRRLVLYRQGPLRLTERPPWGTALQLAQRDRPSRRSLVSKAGMTEDPSGSSRISDLAPARADRKDVSLAMRLLAAETEEEAGRLIVEVAAPDLSGEGVFEIEWQGKRSQCRLRLGAQTSLRMPLPSPEGPLTGEEVLDHVDHAHPIRYTLRGAQGDLLLSGEVTLVTLFEQEDVVEGEVGPFQFDRAEYLPGDSLQARLRIRGRASAGYRLVVIGREVNGSIFSRTETEVQDSSELLSLVFSLPTSLRPPAVLEYHLLDQQTGFLYQSGQQPIPLRP
ncbi:MAG: hypothetical protein ACOYNR_14600 [Blastocatellia bacterium]